MERKSNLLLSRISLGMLIGSVCLRCGLGAVRSHWIANHLQGGKQNLAFIDRDASGAQAVYLCNESDGVIVEDCTDLFLQLTWIEIVRKVLAGIATAGMLVCLFFTFFAKLQDDE